MRYLFLWPVLLLAQTLLAQPAPVVLRPVLSIADDTLQLREITVTGYAQNRLLLETGASVGLLTRRDLNQRFSTPTPIAALNTLAGVRADERSPGSYRLSIRGSLIRSPFGVRNVKIYWNDLPLTDAGGNTAFNALDVRTLGRMEILKGPSGSLYGAGTGGTIILGGLSARQSNPVQFVSSQTEQGESTPRSVSSQTESAEQGQSLEVSALSGSFGLRGSGLIWQNKTQNTALTASYNHLSSNGYRDHSAMVRDNLTLAGSVVISPARTLSVLGLYADLHYETPGGLTEAQYRADPTASRPATRATASATEQGAGIYQKIGYLGLSHEYKFNNRLRNTTSLYVSTTDFANPFITNYEKRADQSLGGRTVTHWQLATENVPLMAVFGAEYQQNYLVSRNYGNRRGQLDTLQTDDELRSRQSVVFAQLEAELPARFFLTMGISRNDAGYGFARFAPKPANILPNNVQKRSFGPVWLPRVSLLKRLRDNISGFASISTGYSAPTSQEVLSTNGLFNPTLEPERGINIEAGVRGNLFKNRLTFDVVAYRFQLRQTIVQRTADNGSVLFTNAGQTDQRGLEAQLSWQTIALSSIRHSPFSLRIWHSLTLTNYRYADYRQLAVDLSGNRVPGVAPTTAVFGADLETRAGLYAHLTFSFLNPFVLNDANTAFADPARILAATLGYRRNLGKHLTADLYAGGDNLLNQTYSLGYDLNAVGTRYFNAAPARNFVVGLRLGVR
jgi:iron complex outermembrane recepter protein